MRIAICDDAELHLVRLKQILNEYIAQHNELDIAIFSFSNGKDLFNKAEDIGGFDIYLLDVMMPEMNGIELGIKLRQAGYDGKILYLTSSSEYAIDSYKAKATDYILKPFIKKDFIKSFEEALSDIPEKKQKRILVKTKEQNMLLNFDSILYVSLYKRALTYHLTNNTTVQSLTLRTSFTDAVQELLADKRFLQCGQSTVVNLQQVTRVGNDELIFKNSDTLFFNKKLCRNIRSVWSEFWLNKES